MRWQGRTFARRRKADQGIDEATGLSDGKWWQLESGKAGAMGDENSRPSVDPRHTGASSGAELMARHDARRRARAVADQEGRPVAPGPGRLEHEVGEEILRRSRR